MSYGSDANKKKKLAVVVVSSFILVVIGVAVTVGVSRHNSDNGDDSHVSASNKAVQAMCQPVDYKDACIESLQGAGPNVTNPKDLVKVGFEYTKKKLAEVLALSETLKEVEKDPVAKQALEICRDQVDLAIYHLQDSFDKMGAFDVSKVDDVLDDLETWLSAVITFQGTCYDEFENVTSPAIPKVKEALNQTMKFSTNALVMVQQLSEIFKSLNIPVASRRLLQEGDQVLGHGEFPSWIDASRRRLLAAGPVKANLVIAQDGSGNFRTFTEAIKHLPVNSMTPFVVHVKAGIYREKPVVPKEIWNITWIGDGADKTKVSFNKNYVDGTKTYFTSTFTLQGAGHTFKNIGFENTAGAIKEQAVAIVIDGDRTAFFNCRFDGYQDTLYSHANRQYYRDCTITGTIDFVFGDARALYQNCLILVRRPMDNQKCVVAASGREVNHTPGALVFQNCRITGDQTYMPVKAQFKTYLGRPWKIYAKTLFIQCFLDDIISPDGWMVWKGDHALATCYYGEYQNRGPGSNMAARAKWAGIKHITPKVANKYVGAKLLGWDNWVRATGIPYVPTLMNV